MGTVLEITLCSTDTAQDQQTLAALFTSAARLDSLLTTFSPHSPLSRLNARAGRGAQPVPPEVAEVLSLSLSYWRLTGGTFDVTVGPLMALWRQAAVTHTLPSPAAVQRARARVGSEKLRLSSAGRVSLTRTGMAIDLGGIGKGYALDQLAGLLSKQGITNALLDFGQSSMWALGAPPDAAGWRLLVQQPDGGTVGVITLHDQALSVSGSLGQSVTVNGQRYAVSAGANSLTSGQRDGLGKNRRTAEFMGGGALLGAMVGAIAGGGKGAAIGAAAGAGPGAGTQVLTRGNSVRVPAESLLTFRLDQPLQMGAADRGFTRNGHHYHYKNR